MVGVFDESGSWTEGNDMGSVFVNYYQNIF